MAKCQDATNSFSIYSKNNNLPVPFFFVLVQKKNAIKTMQNMQYSPQPVG